MEHLRRESGAVVILNADQVLAGDTSLDITDRAIELFNTMGPEARVPDIDLTLPVTELVTPEAKDEGATQQ